MNLNDVGKELPMKVIMSVKAPNGKLLFLFERQDGKLTQTEIGRNIQQLKIFMKAHKDD